MAIKISGSTIIDDSRNIVNAGVVTATSFYGDGSNLTNISSGGGSIAGINTLGTSHFNNLNITGFATFANGGRAIFEDILEFRGLEAGGANTLDWYDSGGVVDHSIIYNGESFDIGGGDQVKLDASGIGTVFITSAGVSVAEFTEDTVKFYNAVTETETLRITSAGLVGIGTDSPDHKLQVDYTSDDDGFVINNTFRGGKWRFATSGSIGQNFDIRRYDSVNDTYRRFLNLGSDEFSVYTGVTTSSIERLRVTSTGDVQITDGNLVFSTSGTGIDFSATADGSGTTTSELLDDYEEGTWTPSISFSGGNTGMTFEFSPSGTYTKIGNTVRVRFGFKFSNKGSSTGNFRIEGLPYSGLNSSYNHSAGGIIALDTATDATLSMFVTSNTQLQGRIATNSNLSVTDAYFNNISSVFGTIVYDT